jgi:hypothetical protein
MKRFLMITLTAITAVALVAAPVWAAGGRVLSDRQLDGVHAGSAVSDASNANSSADSSSSGDLWIAGAASSAAAATSSDIGSAKAVKVDNKCAAEECKVKVNQENTNTGGSTGNNAQSILNTVASVNAVQINVAAGGPSTQSNMAYSAEGVISEIDSFEAGDASANSAGVTGSLGPGTSFASADSSASAATSASSALAFATPRVEIKNRCAAHECQLKLNDTSTNSGGSTANNAQSILNTVASVNAVQMNVSGAAATQSNIAFSTVK